MENFFRRFWGTIAFLGAGAAILPLALNVAPLKPDESTDEDNSENDLGSFENSGTLNFNAIEQFFLNCGVSKPQVRQRIVSNEVQGGLVGTTVLIDLTFERNDKTLHFSETIQGVGLNEDLSIQDAYEQFVEALKLDGDEYGDCK